MASNARTILIVDDDPAVLTILQHTLSVNGFVALAASDGMEALTFFEQDSAAIDLLITDWQMPNLNGPELAVRVRARRPDLPILFISGLADKQLTATLQQFPRHGFLEKPFATADLVAQVMLLLAEA
jgi:two-component system cell cycle sensor histidine kinase/response regulator CckA